MSYQYRRVAEARLTMSFATRSGDGLIADDLAHNLIERSEYGCGVG